MLHTAIWMTEVRYFTLLISTQNGILIFGLDISKKKKTQYIDFCAHPWRERETPVKQTPVWPFGKIWFDTMDEGSCGKFETSQHLYIDIFDPNTNRKVGGNVFQKKSHFCGQECYNCFKSIRVLKSSGWPEKEL